MNSFDPVTAVASADFALGIPPTPDQVRTARLFAAAVARHFGFPESLIDDLKLAISEACTNSIKAHTGSNLDDSVRILVRKDGERLRFEIVDAGPGFEVPIDADEQAPMTPVQGLFEGSLGLSVIRSLFPEVEIMRNEERGMTVSFTVELEATA